MSRITFLSSLAVTLLLNGLPLGWATTPIRPTASADSDHEVRILDEAGNLSDDFIQQVKHGDPCTRPTSYTVLYPFDGSYRWDGDDRQKYVGMYQKDWKTGEYLDLREPAKVFAGDALVNAPLDWEDTQIAEFASSGTDPSLSVKHSRHFREQDPWFWGFIDGVPLGGLLEGPSLETPALPWDVAGAEQEIVDGERCVRVHFRKRLIDGMAMEVLINTERGYRTQEVRRAQNDTPSTLVTSISEAGAIAGDLSAAEAATSAIRRRHPPTKSTWTETMRIDLAYDKTLGAWRPASADFTSGRTHRRYDFHAVLPDTGVERYRGGPTLGARGRALIQRYYGKLARQTH